jgi:hypothetical protein
MPSYLRLDKHVLQNRLGWRGECGQEMPKYTPGFLGILCAADLSDLESTEITINKRVSAPLDASIAPSEGQYMYHAHVAVNPALLEVAEVTCPTIVFPGQGRVRPTLHIRGLRKFDLGDFPWVASIHLVD